MSFLYYTKIHKSFRSKLAKCVCMNFQQSPGETGEVYHSKALHLTLGFSKIFELNKNYNTGLIVGTSCVKGILIVRSQIPPYIFMVRTTFKDRFLYVV